MNLTHDEVEYHGHHAPAGRDGTSRSQHEHHRRTSNPRPPDRRPPGHPGTGRALRVDEAAHAALDPLRAPRRARDDDRLRRPPRPRQRQPLAQDEPRRQAALQPARDKPDRRHRRPARDRRARRPDHQRRILDRPDPLHPDGRPETAARALGQGRRLRARHARARRPGDPDRLLLRPGDPQRATP